MERVFRSLADAIVGTAELVTSGVQAAHHLMAAALERTVIIEQKSEAAACISAVEHRQNIAARLAKATKFNEENPEMLAKADSLLANYRKQRRNNRQEFVNPFSNDDDQPKKSSKK